MKPIRNSHKLYVGIDSHSEIHKIALIQTTSLQTSTNDLRESKLLDIRNRIADFELLIHSIQEYTSFVDEVVVGIDSCGLYTLPITYYLQRHKYKVFYMENKSKKVSRGYFFDLENKNDVIDSIRVAYFLYLKDLAGSLFRATALRTPDFSSSASLLHTLVLHRQQYIKLITQSTNRLHVFLTGIFPEGEKKYFMRLLKILPYYPTPQEIVRSRGMKRVKGVGVGTKNAIRELAKETVGVPARDYRKLILALCKQREQAVSWKNEITESIENEVNRHPYGAIMLSFPRFGIITAAALIGAIGDVNRWPSDKKLKKALGIYSTFQESGKSMRNRKQGLRGSRLCKTMLYQSVLRCLPDSVPDNDFRDYYRRGVSRGKPKKSAIVATMGKLTEIMYHCLKTGKPYCYQGIYKKHRDIPKRVPIGRGLLAVDDGKNIR